MNVNVNVLEWNDEQRRVSSYVVLGAAVVVALAALALWFFLATTPAWVYWALVGALALVLAFMAVLLFVPPQGASSAAAEAEAEGAAMPAMEGEGAVADAEGEAAAPPMAPPAFEPRVLTLRCGDCGTIFEVTDTGERPLYHTCPGCGAEGALRDEPVAPEMAEPAAEMAAPSPEMEAPQAEPEPAPEAEPMAEPEPAPLPPPAPPAKKIKLRCGGCKEVFTIEDTGERPLTRACPHCGRMGRIN